MTDRERLVELMDEAVKERCLNIRCIDCNYHNPGPYPCRNELVADHLIANGVTVQKWIPVTEGLPKLIPCNAGTAYSEAVNVLTSGRKVLTAIWDGIDFECDARFWEAEGETITHWTPVLLPLPEPPREDE